MASEGTVGDVKPLGAFLAGMSFAVLAAALILLSLWFVQDIHSRYAAALAARQPLFLEHTGYTVFYMAPVVFVGLFIFGAACAFVGLRGTTFSKAAAENLNRVLSALVIIGLIGMFAGSFLANRIWAEHFEHSGYVACYGSFTLTSKWFTTVWAGDPLYCRDEGVRDMFFEGKDIAVINEQIEAGKLPSSVRDI